MPAHLLEWTLLLAALLPAAYFRPWQSLRLGSLHHPWLASLVLLPWLWNAQHLLPSALGLHLSGACLMVLMFGWPLAVLTLLPLGTLAAWLAPGPFDINQALLDTVWAGLVPATLALALGAAQRRWLPHHVFVYILGRGFIGTAAAMMLSAALEVAWRGTAESVQPADMLLGRWLMAWGEAFATGMLTAIFVAFAPQWLLTYSDARYLPPRN